MRRFTLCITSFALVLSLVVVTAVPAFADDSIQVQDGYNIDCVPYSPYISSLIVTDNEEEGSVYYSASKVRTYSATASTFSVSSTSSDTSTDYLYNFHDMWDIWSYYAVVPNHTTGAISKVTDSNGYDGLQFVSTDYTTYPTFRTPDKVLSSLKSGNKYSFSYTLKIPYANWGEFSFYLCDSADTTKQIILAQKEYSTNVSFNKTITATVIIPDDWSGQPCLRFVSDRLENPKFHFTLYINDLTITDITNENLDKSLDKFGDRIDSIINPSEPYNSFDDGSFEGSANELKDAESALPTVDYNAFQDLANSIDLSEYSNTFAAINNLFIRFVDTVGITPLIFFALFFGICIFILGRKLSGG